MQEEHDRELQYLVIRHNRAIDTMARERDAAVKRLAAYKSGMESLLRSQGSCDDRTDSVR
jgi:hypothetical protein